MLLLKKSRDILLLSLIFLFGISGLAMAQVSAFTSLFADNIRFDSAAQRLIASGNVIVIFNDARLEADKIIYDAGLGRVFAEGGIRISGNGGDVFIADIAELSTNLQEGLIRGAKLLMANQFQISAAEIRRTEGRFNTLYRAVGSSCQVCFDRPVPMWQIRAARIIQDTERLRFYFEDARFDVFGVPVLYLPRLSMVAPSVTRATGLLAPLFVSSDVYGYAAKLPYFITFGDHADATIIPFGTSTGAFLLEAYYRQRYANGSVDIAGAFALTDNNGSAGHGFLSVDAIFDIGAGRQLYSDVKLTNNDGFLRRFGFDNSDRLVSSVGIRRYHETGFFEAGAVFFQSLRDDEVDAEVPFALPEINYRKTWDDNLMGGRIGVDVSSVGLFRRTGRDVFRLSGSADWSRDWTAAFGIRASAFAALHADAYRVWNDVGFDDRILFRITPLIGAEMRLPLVKNGKNNVLHVVEPVMQIVFAPDLAFNDSVPNEDSLQVEFDETNLFAINRFPGSDEFETGLRANIGVSYHRYDPSGWTLGVDVGQIFRFDDSGQFSSGSGLNGESSDILAAVSFELPSKVRVVTRLLMGGGFEVRRAESEVLLNFDRFSIDASYVYLAPDVTAGSLVERSEANIGATYQFQPNWLLKLDWRHDLIENQDIFAALGLTYGNECLEIDLSLSRRFTISNSVPAETSFDVSVRLAGFGGGLQNEWPAQRCLQVQ